MQSEILVQAIEKAIRNGAAALPCASNKDLEFVRAQTDVSIDPEVLATFLADLKTDPDMAAREGLFASMSFGGGISVDFSQAARLLLAQAIVTGDVAGTVARFISHTLSNVTPAICVMAISGIKVTEPIRLGPDVMLTPMSAIGPSTQRAMALGQDIFPGFGHAWRHRRRFRRGSTFIPFITSRRIRSHRRRRTLTSKAIRRIICWRRPTICWRSSAHIPTTKCPGRSPRTG